MKLHFYLFDWQPIETAPKDGSRILTMRTRFKKYKGLPEIMWVMIGHWNSDAKEWRMDYGPGAGDWSRIHLTPNWWSPLPKITEDMLA